jgi:hypothetical protein
MTSLFETVVWIFIPANCATGLAMDRVSLLRKCGDAKITSFDEFSSALPPQVRGEDYPKASAALESDPLAVSEVMGAG